MTNDFWESWNTMGEQSSKTFIGWFYLFCLYQGIFGDYSIGWWWLPYLVVGTFGSSLIFALPCQFLTVVIFGLISRLKPQTQPRPAGLIADLVIFIFLVPMFLFIEYNLRLVSLWVGS